jgi:hypothetical protein
MQSTLTPDSPTSRTRAGRFSIPKFFQCYYYTLPILILLIYAHSLIYFYLPNNTDTLDESFEPVKTLKFVHDWGRAVHKWGPMTNLVYAPVYAPFVAYWFWTGDLKSPSTEYPYGFQRPMEQMGALIEVGRVAGLLVGLVATAVYGRSLFQLTGSRLAVFLALMLCMTLSPPLIVSFVSTKPDAQAGVTRSAWVAR